MLEAAIYDMDGLLVDTEWLWQEAEKAVFATVGLELTTEMCLQTMGLRIDEVVQHWYRQHGWTGKSPRQVEAEVLEEVARLIVEKAALRPGVHHALQLMQARNWKLAVASSSPKMLIETVLDHFGLRDIFPLYRSAEDELHGKPHPAVFLRAAKALDVHPTNCLALEDSFNGLLSAKSARMCAIVVPDPEQVDDPRWVIADLKLSSLENLRDEMLEALSE